MQRNVFMLYCVCRLAAREKIAEDHHSFCKWSSVMQDLGRLLMIIGAVLLIIGSLLYFTKTLAWLGKLPGDLSFRKGNFSFHFPLMTSILLSVLLSLVLYFFNKK